MREVPLSQSYSTDGETEAQEVSSLDSDSLLDIAWHVAGVQYMRDEAGGRRDGQRK